MSENLNATCAICGKKYHVCNTCKNTKTFTPWRTIADSVDCYKIYSVIHEYTIGMIKKEETKEMLSNIKMPETLVPHIEKIINEIKSDGRKKNSTKNTEKDNE